MNEIENTPPNLKEIQNQVIPVGGTETVFIFADDQDGDAMTFDIPTNPGFLSLENADQTELMAGATCVMAPTSAHLGSSSATIRVSDGKGGEDWMTFTIRVDSISPEPGKWLGSAEFGQINFKVNEHGTAIDRITFSFSGWWCGGASRYGRYSFGDTSWAIDGGEFSIEALFPWDNLYMTVHGTMNGDYAATGTWSGLSNGIFCSGEWVASDRGYWPELAVTVRPNFHDIQDIVGFHWLPGSRVTLEIDNGPDQTVDFTRTAVVDYDGIVRFQHYVLGHPFDFGEGDIIRIYDDKEMIAYAVQFITLELVDRENDILIGHARPGTVVGVGARDNFPPFHSYEVSVTADANGIWTADLSDKFDIVPGSGGGVGISSGFRAGIGIQW
jgi:hypothetical protein